jgi:hypothetical protein
MSSDSIPGVGGWIDIAGTGRLTIRVSLNGLPEIWMAFLRLATHLIKPALKICRSRRNIGAPNLNKDKAKTCETKDRELGSGDSGCHHVCVGGSEIGVPER